METAIQSDSFHHLSFANSNYYSENLNTTTTTTTINKNNSSNIKYNNKKPPIIQAKLIKQSSTYNKSLEKLKFNTEILKHDTNSTETTNNFNCKKESSIKKLVNLNDAFTSKKSILKQKQKSQSDFVSMLPKIDKSYVTNNDSTSLSTSSASNNNNEFNNNNNKETPNKLSNSSSTTKGKSLKHEILNQQSNKTHTNHTSKKTPVLVDLNKQSLDAMTFVSSNDSSINKTNLNLANRKTMQNVFNSGSKNQNFDGSISLYETSVNNFQIQTTPTSNSSSIHFGPNNLLGEIKENIVKRHKNSLINRLGLQVVEGNKLNISDSQASSNPKLTSHPTQKEINKCAVHVRDFESDMNESQLFNQPSELFKPKEQIQTQFRLKPLKMKKTDINLMFNDESILNLRQKYTTKIAECSKMMEKTNAFTLSLSYPGAHNKLPKIKNSLNEKNSISSSNSNSGMAQEDDDHETAQQAQLDSNVKNDYSNFRNPNLKIANEKINLTKRYERPNEKRESHNVFELEYFTRVESPYQLQKSNPNNYMYISNSSMNVNKKWFNQQFELYQSQQYDDDYYADSTTT